MQINYIEIVGKEFYQLMREAGYRKFSKWDLSRNDLVVKLKIKEDVIDNLLDDRKHFVSGGWYVFKHMTKGVLGYGMGFDPDLNVGFNIFEE